MNSGSEGINDRLTGDTWRAAAKQRTYRCPNGSASINDRIMEFFDIERQNPGEGGLLNQFKSRVITIESIRIVLDFHQHGPADPPGYPAVRTIIEDVFKMARNVFSLRNFRQNSTHSAKMAVSLIVLLPGLLYLPTFTQRNNYRALLNADLLRGIKNLSGFAPFLLIMPSRTITWLRPCGCLAPVLCISLL